MYCAGIRDDPTLSIWCTGPVISWQPEKKILIIIAEHLSTKQGILLEYQLVWPSISNRWCVWDHRGEQTIHVVPRKSHFLE